MILAGIDEAGLGPALGPLCVGCAALEAPEHWAADTPWTALEAVVCREARRREERLAVTDSKRAHTTNGVAGLERTVLAFLRAGTDALPKDRDALLGNLLYGSADEIWGAAPWYDGATWAVPGFMERDAMQADAARLAEALAGAEARVAALRASLLPAAMLNGRWAHAGNKADVLLAEVGRHLRFLDTAFPHVTVDVTVDKLGGRNQYVPFLMDVFPGAWIDTRAEGCDASVYGIRRSGAVFRVRFLPRADGSAFAVGLASCLAKYLRERCMADLNAFFRQHLPDLKPTAGYHGDAPRFLEAVVPVLAAAGIPRALLVRER